MTLMHQSAQAHHFHMAFSFGGTSAAYLTPATVLAGAASFSAAKKVASSGLQLEHVQRTAIASYWVILHRWAEMVAYAKAANVSWPVEPTIEGAFQSFALGVNLTQDCYGAPIKTSEGGPSIDLAALKVAWQMGPCPAGTKRVDPTPSPCHSISCPTNWTRNGTDIRLPCDTPAPQACHAPAHGPLAHTVPLDITASSVYNGHLNKTTGAWGAYGYTGWIELEFTPGTLIGNMTAVFGMSPNGAATNVLTLDGHPIATWSGPMKSGYTMNWSPTMPVAATKLRMTTEKDPSWVSYSYIKVFTC